MLAESYAEYKYNTLNNYLSKNKTAYENDMVKIEGIVVRASAIPQRKIVMTGKLIDRKKYDEEKVDKEYWLSRPIEERLAAATRLRAQVIGKAERIDKSYGRKRNMK